MLQRTRVKFKCHYHYYFRSSNVATNNLGVLILPLASESEDALLRAYRLNVPIPRNSDTL